jgi:AcrR family transcriptional regulator
LSPLDGNALRTERTRRRILAEALEQFNEHGEAHVTPGAIAAALGMSPGNLYYHFRNKDRIVEELFAELERRLDSEPPVAAGAGEAIEDLWLYLHLMLEAIWEFRFLYRNLDDVVARNHRLREHFRRIAGRKRDAVVRLCETLVAARAMRATPEEIRALARNVLVVATYWLNFQSLSRGHHEKDADLGAGAHQVMSLFAPYLRGDARRHLDRLSRRYLE